MKLHVGLEHDSYLPAFAIITLGKTSDIAAGRTLCFPKGSIVVCDKGYTDYRMFKMLMEVRHYLRHPVAQKRHAGDTSTPRDPHTFRDHPRYPAASFGELRVLTASLLGQLAECRTPQISLLLPLVVAITTTSSM